MSGPDIRVCFLGDSFTLGTGDDTGLGWPGRVLAEARGRGVDLSGYNLGIRGQTGAEIAERASAEITVRIDERGDKRGVIVAFGANDVRLERPFEESLRAMQGVLRWCAAQGYQTFVLGITPAVEPYIDETRKQLSRRLSQAAADAGVPFLDVRGAVSDWSAWRRDAAEGDGVHPNAEGYRLVADAVIGWPAWRAWLGVSLKD